MTAREALHVSQKARPNLDIFSLIKSRAVRGYCSLKVRGSITAPVKKMLYDNGYSICYSVGYFTVYWDV